MFTDEDLKKLEEDFATDKEFHANAMWVERDKLDGLLKRLQAAEAVQEGERCEVCPDQGWYGEMTGGCDSDGEHDTREAVQVQCEFCYTNPNSKFNRMQAWRKVAGK